MLVTSGELDLADIQAFHVIPASSWVKTAGQTNIYETTDTENFSVLWEIAVGTPASLYWKSMIWLSHPIGANFAAVAASLDNTAGSFWTDGVKMYVHPFGNTAAGSLRKDDRWSVKELIDNKDKLFGGRPTGVPPFTVAL